MTWDVENRVATVSGGASFVYDGDGVRVKKTEGGQTTLYINKYYEVNTTADPDVATTSYYLGAKLIAQREGETLRYVHQDHLGGTTVTSTSAGALESSVRYLPFGGARLGSGPLPTEVQFTGQRLDATGLYYYGARYYDAEIGRFVSADPTVPSMSNPQALNRYSYVVNNPLKYTDPTGLFYVQIEGMPLQDCDQDGACVVVSDAGGYEGAPVSNPCLSDPLCGIDVTPPAASSGGSNSGSTSNMPVANQPVAVPAVPQPSFNLPATPIPPSFNLPSPGQHQPVKAAPTKSLEQQRWEEDMKWVRKWTPRIAQKGFAALSVFDGSVQAASGGTIWWLGCRARVRGLCEMATIVAAPMVWEGYGKILKGVNLW